jgi:AcrR family transcriptional regulator
MTPNLGQPKPPRPGDDREADNKRRTANERGVRKDLRQAQQKDPKVESRRGGRESVIERVLDAAEELFSSHGFYGTSVRDVAAAAGVSHALVHRYLGTKADLLAAVFHRGDGLLVDAASSVHDVREAVVAMLAYEPERSRRYLRLIVRSCLEGVPYPSSHGLFPSTRLLVELAERQVARAAAAEEGDGDHCLDPRLVVASAVALALGWFSLDPWLITAAKLDSWSREELDAGLRTVILRLLEASLPLEDAARAEGPAPASTPESGAAA